MSAQPARLIQLPHRTSPRPTIGAPLEPFLLADIPSVPTPTEQPLAVEALLGEAWEALERDAPVEAARKLANVLRNEPANAEALLALGSIQHMQGDLIAAAESYRRAAAADPTGWQPSYNHALLHEMAGEQGEAIALLYQAIALAPLEALPQCRLALLLELGDHDAEAHVWWKRAVAADPGLTDAWLRLGLLELRLGNLPEAARALEKAQSGDQEAADAAYHLGLAHIGMGASEAAAEALAEAVQRDPTAADAHLALAGLALESGDLEAAEHHERTLRALRLPAPALSFRLAQAFALRGEMELAKEHYKRAVQSDSSLALGYFALTL